MTRNLIAALALLAVGCPAFAADNFVVKDGSGATITKRAKDVGSGVEADANVLLNSSFSVIDPATSTLQATANTKLDTIVTTLGSPLQAGASVGISGTLPAFAATPTFNLGTLNGAATAALQGTTNTKLDTIVTTLGSPLQAGASVGISGTLPAFASAPTFNLGTLNGAATAAKQPALGTAGTPSADVITVQGAASGTPLPTDPLSHATATDRGGTITTGGTSQTLMSANSARRGMSVQNQSTGDLYIGPTTATADYHSLKIAAGAYFETSVHAGTGAVGIIGATTGQAFYAREW